MPYSDCRDALLSLQALRGFFTSYVLRAMNHPEHLPQYRPCAGTCGRSLLVSAENFPTRKKEPNRYPWQLSYYRPRCHQCHREFLGDLNARTKAERYAKETSRQRENRAAVKGSLGMTWAAVKQGRAKARAKLAQTLAKAARNAEVRRTMRGARPYDPATDPFKRMIRERQRYYLSKRLQRGLVNTDLSEIREASQMAPDFLRMLEEIRSRHRS